MSEDYKTVEYTLNERDEIVSASDSWNEFAIANGAPELVFDKVRGRSLWDFIHDVTIRHIYRLVLDRVRSGSSAEFDFRCDSPELRRFLTIQMAPLKDGGVRFKIVTVRVEQRTHDEMLAVETDPDDKMIIGCSWCKRLRTVDGMWLEPEHLMSSLQLFDRESVQPRLSHGMCDKCYQNALEQIKTR